MKTKAYQYNVFLPVVSALFCSFMQISDAWWLCGICMVPLMHTLVKSEKPHKSLAIFFIIYHFSLNAYLLTLYDTIGINRIAAIVLCLTACCLLTLYQSAVMLLCCVPSGMIKGKILRLTVFSFCYILGQYALGLVPYIKYTWARLENALAYEPILLQTSSLLGGDFTALLILLFNLSLYFLALYLSKSEVAKTAVCSAVCSLIFFGSVFFGFISINRKTDGEYISVIAIQDDVEGFDKRSVSYEQAISDYKTYFNEFIKKDYDLVLLPETAIPTAISDNIENELTASLPTDASLVYGALQREGENCYNCLKLADSDSVRCKKILVPFGEYMPFCDIEGFPSLNACNETYTIKTESFDAAGLICIESIYSGLLDEQIDMGAEIVLLSTNDSWFKSSYARELHFRHSIVRAAEYDRYVIRSANCGISAIIDRNGFVLSAERGKSAGYVDGTVELSDTKTLYSVVGNILAVPPFVFVILYYIRTMLNKIFHKDILA